MNTAIMLACLAAHSTIGQHNDTVFNAPNIQVKKHATKFGEEELPYHFLMYHRTFIGSNFLKPADNDDIGKLDKDFSRLATSYYHSHGPVGVALQKFNWFPGPLNTYHADARLPASLIGMAGVDSYGQLGQMANLWSEPPVAVVGLEVGTLASYARPSQQMHFFARVKSFVKMSLPDKGKTRYFHYLDDALQRGAAIRLFEGELRPTVETKAGAGFYHLIAVDIYDQPDHVVLKELMTCEAIEMLVSKLTENGVLCFHTSSRYYELPATIASAAKELNYACLVGRYARERPSAPGAFACEWVMIARKSEHLNHLKKPSGYNQKAEMPFWYPPPNVDKKYVWSDKTENSLRGIYTTDPDIFRLREHLDDAWDFLHYKIGVPDAVFYRVMPPIYDFINRWSEVSARRKNGGTLPNETGTFAREKLPATVHRAPQIEVRKSRDEHYHHYLLYNGINVGRNYLKPADPALHGNPEKDLSRLPITYFHDKSPIGVVLQKYNWFPRKENTYHADARLPASLIGMAGLAPSSQLGQACQLWSEPAIAVIGMDVGVMASYARPAQNVHFFERNPEIVKLSLPKDGEIRYFRYIHDAENRGANIRVFEGEPRPAMEKNAGDGFYQVVVVSTYKLPVTTVHKELMTKEGMRLLMNKMRDDGILCVHVSNRYYDLVPIIASTAQDLGYAALVGTDPGRWENDRRSDRFASTWVMVARDAKYLGTLKEPEGFAKAIDPYWALPGRVEKKFIWTDKGANSFRGVYYADPDIEKWRQPLETLEQWIEDRTGIPASNYTRRLHGIITASSRASVNVMNRDTPRRKQE